MIKDRIKLNLIFILATLFFISCDSNQVYERNLELADYTWHMDSIKVFEVDIQDTINPHNIYINVRNTSQYQMQNLFLFIQTTAPSGVVLRDTFECYLADDRGKWTGSGWGDIYDNQFLYKKNIRFPVSGKYRFEYIQAMRIENLKHISDIGLRIEKSELR